MGSGGDVVLQIRMTNPPPKELHAAVLELHGNHRSKIRNRMTNHFVPMYVYGFLCVGETGYDYHFRSLGMAHRIFRDLSLDAPNYCYPPPPPPGYSGCARNVAHGSPIGGDVVLRIRMTNPPPEELHAAVLELHSNLRSEIRNRMTDHFVPMYVSGFLCVGKTGYDSHFRSLGMDHRIFRDLSLDTLNTPLQKYDKCPLLHGCLIINL
ncbi:hypothetical protein AXG93_154s1620 [Marchantia polymorpha subsp. ruderalis]|uniref:Uncharacterized protein n=1 Tax=Marchantia polymorpha subsp. ruderalis TaxID=1480154 RepID=A0A176VIA3_MARPO|nr:hypothetical protein AXG93_154s1620 [Marchantia polymorpha subsp. ruderalis]